MLRAALLLLVAGLGILGARAADGVGSYMYGQVDISGERWIVQYNPVLQEEQLVLNTHFTDNINAMAFDVVRNQLLFVGGNDQNDLAGTYNLWVLDIDTMAMTFVAPYTELGFMDYLLDNAAWFEDGYWYRLGMNPAVNKVTFVYTNGIPTAIATKNTYQFSDQTVTVDHSDIAINVSYLYILFVTYPSSFFQLFFPQPLALLIPTFIRHSPRRCMSRALMASLP